METWVLILEIVELLAVAPLYGVLAPNLGEDAMGAVLPGPRLAGTSPADGAALPLTCPRAGPLLSLTGSISSSTGGRRL